MLNNSLIRFIKEVAQRKIGKNSLIKFIKGVARKKTGKDLPGKIDKRRSTEENKERTPR